MAHMESNLRKDRFESDVHRFAVNENVQAELVEIRPLTHEFFEDGKRIALYFADSQEKRVSHVAAIIYSTMTDKVAVVNLGARFSSNDEELRNDRLLHFARRHQGAIPKGEHFNKDLCAVVVCSDPLSMVEVGAQKLLLETLFNVSTFVIDPRLRPIEDDESPPEPRPDQVVVRKVQLPDYSVVLFNPQTKRLDLLRPDQLS